eukprot:gnl/MRDRNA2_/MRDRNA2_45166_c0_seq1.p1 gnl/MRDRNA2_/MRDRNA2_45166_c0~~gnl/MRDRNA2_/MRDRNA2_45166_c0_seq1.p1  ORF type:complete len:288 (-),score=41.96 gnl/MRDRNA2_/MRDRNA2_45166_c0_seq1:127-906(-)
MVLKLEAVGFCGVDDTTDPAEVIQMSLAYPWIEWGVLFRSDKQGMPRYASRDFLQKLIRACSHSEISAGPLRLAGHLCGKECQSVLEGNPEVPKSLNSEFGFRRFQLNPTKVNGVHLPDLAACAANIRRVVEALPDLEFILQVNDETKSLFDAVFNSKDSKPPANLAVLFDPSAGLGTLPASRPKPLSGVHCGFAGGLGPDTITQELASIRNACTHYDGSIWIDMETRIRSTNKVGNDAWTNGWMEGWTDARTEGQTDR